MAAVSVTQVDDQTHARKICTNVNSKSSKFELFELKFKSSKVQKFELLQTNLS